MDFRHDLLAVVQIISAVADCGREFIGAIQ
jgi:hypothetical protein